MCILFISIKLVTGMTIVKLTKEFGEFNNKHICEIYHVMIGMVDSKARKLYMVLIVLANGWHLFWTFQG
jgi:hypothetical protein